MAYGLEVYDSSGQLMFDIGDTLGVIVAKFDTVVGSSGSVFIPETAGAEIFWLCFPIQAIPPNVYDFDETGGVILETNKAGLITWRYDFTVIAGSPPGGRPLVSGHHVYVGVF